MYRVDPSLKRKYTEEAIAHFTPVDLEEVALVITKKMLEDNNVLGCFGTSDLGIDARTSIFSGKSIIVMVSIQSDWVTKLTNDLKRINNIEFTLSEKKSDNDKSIFKCLSNPDAQSLRKYDKFYYFTSCKTTQKKVEETKIGIKNKFCIQGEIYHRSTLIPELMENSYLQKTYVQPKFQRLIELVDDWKELSLKKYTSILSKSLNTICQYAAIF